MSLSKNDLQNMANSIRVLSMDAVEKAKSGHPGAPMGMADIATILFSKFITFNPTDPNWPDRDRFVLSNGHGSMLLYSLLYLTGYEDVSLQDIKDFRQLGAKTCGHPEYGEAAGIETTTGPLGQGIANGVGMALAERLSNARNGDGKSNHFTYVFTGDGCLMEGISHEALSLAGHLNLNKLIIFFDDNNISIDGELDIACSDDVLKRMEAYGFATQKIDGHNFTEIEDAIKKAQNSDKPSFIACKTLIGKGAPNKEGTSATHGAPLGEEEVANVRKNLGWPHAAFEIPEEILKNWRNVWQRNKEIYEKWQRNNKKYSAEVNLDVAKLATVIDNFKKDAVSLAEKVATRKSSGKVLEVLTKNMSYFIGGSADLTGSNLTKTSYTKPISKNNFSGSYIYYGVREHAMAAIMNGIALHGEFIPYSGTFFVFTDYCRPAIRLSALMKKRVIYVMTHDSIGLGEDGPTHQPVEHLASLRSMPNVNIFRPCDDVETAEAWQNAILSDDRPTILCLTRQSVPLLRVEHQEKNLSEKGGYVISQSEKKANVTIIATGSEVHLATEAQKILAKEDIFADVVSMPCFELFDEQNKAYKESVLPSGTLKIAVEAGVQMGWEKYIGNDGIFIGMNSFGASAPAEELYQKFGITVDAIIAAARTVK